MIALAARPSQFDGTYAAFPKRGARDQQVGLARASPARTAITGEREVGHPPCCVRPTMATVSERVSQPWPFRLSRRERPDPRVASTCSLTAKPELAQGIAPPKVYRDPKLVELLVADMAEVLNRVRDRDGVEAPAVLARVERDWLSLVTAAEERRDYAENMIRNLL